MCGEGIGLLSEYEDELGSVVFARGLGAEELAVRMGGTPGGGVELTGAEVDWLIGHAEIADTMVARVGECGGWAFAVLPQTGYESGSLAIAASRGGVDVVHYEPMPWHPPSQFSYCRDGRQVCGFGIGEESQRWGDDPDHLLPVLVAGGVLGSDGAGNGSARSALAVIGEHFGWCLPRESVRRAALPAYTVRGRVDLGPDPDYEVIRAWAAEHGYALDWPFRGRVPEPIRAAHAMATRN
ncbi:hypothetical protein ABZ896_29340 [Streptomyces sp. NPDC047072]|uniref:DUF6461 domain-containing protein n=1 Tax=Streptomyces sp. NPDC047072 TaxID=3154809 RepID=UPI003404B1D2